LLASITITTTVKSGLATSTLRHERGVASDRRALLIEIGIEIEIGEGFDIAAVSDPDPDLDRACSCCTAKT
jgi:hypothetical protein